MGDENNMNVGDLVLVKSGLCIYDVSVYIRFLRDSDDDLIILLRKFTSGFWWYILVRGGNVCYGDFRRAEYEVIVKHDLLEG